jgi:YidC/Oxa1 family membrane protein insertase
MNFIQPEINKATKKYNNKTDQESMMKKNEETQRIQKKYGVSLTSGCLPSLIQLPVFYGLYRVIQNIPAYVGDMKTKYVYIVDALKNATVDTSKLTNLGLENKATYIDVINAVATDADGKVSTAVQSANIMMKAADSSGNVSTDKVIDVLDKMSSTDWNQLLEVFKFENTDVANTVAANVDKFQNMNQFVFGINISEAPGMKLTVALLVPILSALMQFISSKITMNASKNNANKNDPAQAQANSMMNMMTYGMPLMSFFICVNLPVAIGLYWIIGAVISIITQLIINNYYNKCDMEAVLEKCKEKAAKKEAKRQEKHPGKKSFYEKMMDAQNGNVSTENSQSESINKMASSRLKSYTNATVDEVKKTENKVHYKEGSIGSKANIMLQYQNKSNEKGGK